MLEIKNINKSFQGKEILHAFNLTISEGEIVCLVGPSGGGKTTLLRCISGLETIDSGEILLNQRPIDRKQNEIGVVFQEFHLFPHLTVLENVMLAPRLKKVHTLQENLEQAKALLTQFELDEKSQYYPYQLSGGQKQRVALARALMVTPSVLCYDEPTSALDPALTQQVAKHLLSLKEANMMQLVVTHDEQFAQLIGDQIIKINAK